MLEENLYHSEHEGTLVDIKTHGTGIDDSRVHYLAIATNGSEPKNFKFYDAGEPLPKDLTSGVKDPATDNPHVVFQQELVSSLTAKESEILGIKRSFLQRLIPSSYLVQRLHVGRDVIMRLVPKNRMHFFESNNGLSYQPPKEKRSLTDLEKQITDTPEEHDSHPSAAEEVISSLGEDL